MSGHCPTRVYQLRTILYLCGHECHIAQRTLPLIEWTSGSPVVSLSLPRARWSFADCSSPPAGMPHTLLQVRAGRRCAADEAPTLWVSITNESALCNDSSALLYLLEDLWLMYHTLGFQELTNQTPASTRAAPGSVNCLSCSLAGPLNYSMLTPNNWTDETHELSTRSGCFCQQLRFAHFSWVNSFMINRFNSSINERMVLILQVIKSWKLFQYKLCGWNHNITCIV